MSTVIEAAPGPVTTAAEEKVAVATQLQLTWWRFRKHKVAVASAFIVAFFYLVAVLADFLAVSNPHATEAGRSYIPDVSSEHLAEVQEAARTVVSAALGS